MLDVRQLRPSFSSFSRVSENRRFWNTSERRGCRRWVAGRPVAQRRPFEGGFFSCPRKRRAVPGCVPNASRRIGNRWTKPKEKERKKENQTRQPEACESWSRRALRLCPAPRASRTTPPPRRVPHAGVPPAVSEELAAGLGCGFFFWISASFSGSSLP